MRLKISIAFLLVLATPVRAQFATPILYNNGTLISPQFPRWNWTGDVVCTAASPFINCAFTGASGATLQTAYNNSAGANPSIQLTAAFAPVTIRATALPMGDLFTVQSTGATTKFLNVADNDLMTFTSAESANTDSAFLLN